MQAIINRRSFITSAAVTCAAAVAAPSRGAHASEQGTSEESDGTREADRGTSLTQHPWEECPGEIAESDIADTFEYDVVVIGLGASGVYAATSAVENGLSVAVLERNDAFNANGGSHFMWDSTPLKESGVALDKEAAVKDFLNVCNNRVDGSAVWTWANRAGEALDWFAGIVEPYGLRPVMQQYTEEPITCVYPGTIIFVGGDNEPTSAVDQDPYNGDLGLGFVPEIDLLGALVQELQAKGADIRFGMTSERIVKEDSGRVDSVIAQDVDGVFHRFVGTKGIVVATGSYDQDPDMHDYFCPMVSHSPVADRVKLFNNGDGSGIKQSLWVGAAMQANPDHPPMMFWGATNCIKNVMVNEGGMRFIDETTGQSNMAAAQLLQRDGVMVALWNDAYAEQLPAVPYRVDDDSFTASPEELLSKWNGLVEAGVFMKADSLDEVADAYDIDADALRMTVEQYNDYCARGVDEAFHKDPAQLHELTGPYFATRYDVPASLASMGGLHVNARCEVLDAKDSPIEGLYAVGLAAGDFYANQYTTRFAGNSLGRCMTFGYLVGRELAGLEG
jgi:fumarate reductase flavoprotein subunit